MRLVVFTALLILVSGHHDCERPCRKDEPPKKCYYHFRISVGFEECINAENGECQRRIVLTVNGNSPGPCISVCENDSIIVDVRNALPSGMETSIHWHGLSQRGRPHMDGVPMITQCPIHSGTAFRYSMTADRAGTFYYHAHSVFQQLDGLVGALIVRRDATKSRVNLFVPRLQDVTSIQSGIVSDLSVTEIKSASHDLGDDGQPERIRIINAAALDCSLKIVSDDMTIVAFDGNEIQPSQTTDLILHPGERADILSGSEYHVFGMDLCAGKTIPVGIGRPSTQNPKYLENYTGTDAVVLDEDSYQVFLPYDVAKYSFLDNPTDFRYKLGEVTPIAPSYISGYTETVSVHQFNNISFLYPSSPLLSQPHDIDRDVLCSYGTTSKRCGSGFCECLNVLHLPYNRSIDLILVDEGKGGKTVQTVHIHGHTFRVIGMGSFPNPTTANELKDQIDSGMVPFNMASPVEKDTVAVPNPGYVVLRLQTINPGDWLVESIPSKARSGIGLELILHVPAPGNAETTPKNFPRCGSLKPQDLVIIEE